MASTESAVEAIHCGVFEYLRKPFNFELLHQIVARAFARLDADQLREDTAAMITHDIKIPLTSIIGFASMIYDRGRREFHPRAREFVGAIQANGQKILAMIDNYLTTCKIEAGTLQVTRVGVDLRHLLQDVIENARLLAERRGREIALEIGPIPETLNIDEPLIYRAVGNILQNAIKYSGEGEAIRLRAGRLAAQDSPLRAGTVCIETFNCTTLVSPDALEGIFQRYKRMAHGSGIEGSGLGLYVVQAIVKAHGGDVTAELLEGGLVRFAIYLPT
jgi:two-component system sensor histidine kinase KdpD